MSLGSVSLERCSTALMGNLPYFKTLVPEILVGKVFLETRHS